MGAGPLPDVTEGREGARDYTSEMASDQDRLTREQQFHDARFGADMGRTADRFYAINRASDAYFRQASAASVQG